MYIYIYRERDIYIYICIYIEREREIHITYVYGDGPEILVIAQGREALGERLDQFHGVPRGNICVLCKECIHICMYVYIYIYTHTYIV